MGLKLYIAFNNTQYLLLYFYTTSTFSIFVISHQSITENKNAENFAFSFLAILSII